MTLTEGTLTVMAMERVHERSWIVTDFSRQPAFRNECFDFRLMQLDDYIADALSAPAPMQAYSRGGRPAGCPFNIIAVVRRFPRAIPFAGRWRAAIEEAPKNEWRRAPAPQITAMRRRVLNDSHRLGDRIEIPHIPGFSSCAVVTNSGFCCGHHSASS